MKRIVVWSDIGSGSCGAGQDSGGRYPTRAANSGNFGYLARLRDLRADNNLVIQVDTIFVSGMNPELNEDDIAQHFGSIGIIKASIVRGSRQWYLVMMIPTGCHMDKRTQKRKIWLYKDKNTGLSKGEATVTYDDANAAQYNLPPKKTIGVKEVLDVELLEVEAEAEEVDAEVDLVDLEVEMVVVVEAAVAAVIVKLEKETGNAQTLIVVTQTLLGEISATDAMKANRKVLVEVMTDEAEIVTVVATDGAAAVEVLEAAIGVAVVVALVVAEAAEDLAADAVVAAVVEVVVVMVVEMAEDPDLIK
ncbi:hypothetical protein NQ315_000069 [Exocentrus adspersus]|uniref:RRM domain-containing protein n=1 Tax=Exocentrus adspersus TaxID=1586481 RepID=A0AAV8VUN5_9CUCU|nr:hypothetical protein NQ315_000069 [Exocentrus adspersus]